MACCLCFFNGSSKTWLALLVPIFALFSRFSSITLCVIFILFSTLFLFTFSSKQKPNMALKEASKAETEFSPQVQEDTIISPSDDLGDIDTKKAVEEINGPDFLIRSPQDLYSESESLDQFSSTSSEEAYHSSDIEWPYYNMAQRLDCSDDSISDEESLIEIEIPSGQFVISPEKDPIFNNLKCCKQDNYNKDFLADVNEMNEEDSLIEIDIYMGSIKCSSFDI